MNNQYTIKAENNYSTVILGDSRTWLGNYTGLADLIVTSPPYADARKKHYDSIHPDLYVEWFMSFHTAFYEVLKPNGSMIINIKDKIINGVRHRYVWDTIQALANEGWYCIDDYIWSKPNPMPGFWPTRLRDGWEYCFHLCKTKKPYFNLDEIKIPAAKLTLKYANNLKDKDFKREPAQNGSGFGRTRSKSCANEIITPSNVLSIALGSRFQGHPATFPKALPEFFIKLLCPVNGLVIDPFGGSGTTGIAALQNNRNSIIIDNNALYTKVAIERIEKEGLSQP